MNEKSKHLVHTRIMKMHCHLFEHDMVLQSIYVVC
uniref:Uncharacterized protein n=1 Tax=Arundo donax TaxID=35708 RepID=A0A0A9CI42_ARUDO